jgi:hypothetical protein
MVSVLLQIEPDLCGPFSLGTVAVIKLVQRHFELGLDEAAEYVNRCVFAGETVAIPVPEAEAAARFVAAIRALPAVPSVVARVVSSGPSAVL